ncbi:hypothetical protein FQN60_009756 [Etheostoma spectabile]|uniref:Uncharacterized protein n=1 Tax=Etheostoma spectabile TaxID=54343 RepID=A0A5J5DKB8_9PERO|nr:hypothetical protein FQN60_009756 [Etheostoma spectabile]
MEISKENREAHLHVSKQRLREKSKSTHSGVHAAEVRRNKDLRWPIRLKRFSTLCHGCYFEISSVWNVSAVQYSPTLCHPTVHLSGPKSVNQHQILLHSVSFSVNHILKKDGFSFDSRVKFS